jgi:hypothetical protein
MDIYGKKVLVLGGWGLVGKAITRRLMVEKPAGIIITSLKESEAKEEVAYLEKTYPGMGENFFLPWWGNVLVREEYKDLSRQEMLFDPAMRKVTISDVMDDLSDEVLQQQSLYKLLEHHKPDVIIDCINTATGIAYQDIFTAYKNLKKVLYESDDRDLLVTETEKLVAVLYIPQLIRHIQVLYNSMHKFDTKVYLKIGTSGTGGMGLNIPYTHSEERPSRVLLSKSAIAGAHSLLLFLMARTPDSAITKEIKPAAAIAWKKIEFGTIKKQGREVEIFDIPLDAAVPLEGKIFKELGKKFEARDVLRSVYIDTGENGIFSRGEFEAITAQKQMEFVTPEEIANNAVYEIMGGNTGHDMINALDNAIMQPSYRAGYMQHLAVAKLAKLEADHGVASVAFEMLGPPRLSKLLFEVETLKRTCGNMKNIINKSATELTELCKNFILDNVKFRNEAISVGIPILMNDGASLLRGNLMKIPVFGAEKELEITPENIEKWADAGWIDLRAKNWEMWISRIKAIIDEAELIPEDDTSSLHVRTVQYWNYFEIIDVGKVVSWIFINEEKGNRMKD